jgi:hypothetical protein
MQNVQIPAHDQAAAAKLAQHIGEHRLVGDELIVEPDVANAQADLFEDVENDFQFLLRKRFTSDASVEGSEPHQCLTIEDRHHHLDAKQRKFPLYFWIAVSFIAVAPKNASLMEHIPANAGLQRQFQIIQHAT